VGTISTDGKSFKIVSTKYDGIKCEGTGTAVGQPMEYASETCMQVGLKYNKAVTFAVGNLPKYTPTGPTVVSAKFGVSDTTCSSPTSWTAYGGCYPSPDPKNPFIKDTCYAGNSASTSVYYSDKMCTSATGVVALSLLSPTLDACSGNFGSRGQQSLFKSGEGQESLFESTSCYGLPADSSTNKAACFSATERLTLEGGGSKMLSEVSVGDRVLTADAQGVLSYSPVVFLPHGANVHETVFVELATTGGKLLKATPMHLLQTCTGDLARAGTLEAGACLKTVDGNETVESVARVTAKGIYTAVTENEFLVVNGVVASPFAVAHGITHAFYSLHRTLYKLAPSFMKSPAVVTANALLGPAAVLGMGFIVSK